MKTRLRVFLRHGETVTRPDPARIVDTVTQFRYWQCIVQAANRAEGLQARNSLIAHLRSVRNYLITDQ